MVYTYFQESIRLVVHVKQFFYSRNSVPMKCPSHCFGNGCRNSYMLVLGMAEWSQLPLVKLVVMMIVVLKTPLSVLCVKPCWFSFLFSFGWSVVAADGAKPDCTF